MFDSSHFFDFLAWSWLSPRGCWAGATTEEADVAEAADAAEEPLFFRIPLMGLWEPLEADMLGERRGTCRKMDCGSFQERFQLTLKRDLFGPRLQDAGHLTAPASQRTLSWPAAAGIALGPTLTSLSRVPRPLTTLRPTLTSLPCGPRGCYRPAAHADVTTPRPTETSLALDPCGCYFPEAYADVTTQQPTPTSRPRDPRGLCFFFFKGVR